jgi:3-phenylpropionate/trans-cinnamate dioxygenase ferredoxin subunit
LLCFHYISNEAIVSEWTDVIADSALAEGECAVADVDGVDVAVFRIDGGLYAIQDVCTHDGAEIASGVLESGEIICPRHGARFCVKTGKALKAPAYADLPCFPVRVENGRIQVRDARWD